MNTYWKHSIATLLALCLSATIARADCTFEPTAVCSGVPCGNETRSSGFVFYNGDTGHFIGCQGNEWIRLDLANNQPSGCPNVGDLCGDQSYYIGEISGKRIYATAAERPSNTSWSSVATSTGFRDTTDGAGNTAGLVARSDAGAPYNAAQYCDQLVVHHHSDWYLPAKDELNLMYNGGAPVAGVNTDGSGYWSSTENSSPFTWAQRFDTGAWDTTPKTNGAQVKCVRSPGAVPPRFARIDSSFATSIPAATSHTHNFGFTVTAGNLLVVAATWDKQVTAPSATGWTQAAYDMSAAQTTGAIFYKIATGAETSVDLSWTGSEEMTIWVAEYSGVAAASPLDVAASADSAGANTQSQSTGTTGATTQPDTLAIALVGLDSGDNADSGIAWTNGFSSAAHLCTSCTAAPGLAIATKTLNATGTVETTFSTTDSGDGMVGMVAVFKGD